MTTPTTLERPVYGMSQAARLLGLRTDALRRWVDGYDRAGTTYAPVIREERTGSDTVTWGRVRRSRLPARVPRQAGHPAVPASGHRDPARRTRRALPTRHSQALHLRAKPGTQGPEAGRPRPLDLSSDAEVLLAPQAYPDVALPEDRLFVPAEYMPLRRHHGWKRG